MGAVSVKFTKKHYDLAERLASEGASRATIADRLGVSVPTLYRRFDRDEKLKVALTRGDELDLQVCVNSLREKALAGSYPHMDRYLQLRHGLFIGNAKPMGLQGNTTIVVAIPFQTGINGDNVANMPVLDTYPIHDVIEHEDSEEDQ